MSVREPIPSILCFSGFNAADPSSSASRTVTVIDRDLDGILLAAAPLIDLQGVVILETGASLRMPTSVDAKPSTVFAVPPATSPVDKNDGTFRLAGLRAADYKLAVSPVPGGYITSIQFGGRDVMDGNINSSGSGTLVIRIAAGRGRLSGKVDFGSGKPIEGMRVTLAPDGPLSDRTDLIRTVFTNATGEFALTDLAPGGYRIFPWEKPEFDLEQAPEFLRLFAASSVRVEEGAPANVEVKMISSGEIEAAKARF